MLIEGWTGIAGQDDSGVEAVAAALETCSGILPVSTDLVEREIALLEQGVRNQHQGYALTNPASHDQDSWMYLTHSLMYRPERDSLEVFEEDITAPTSRSFVLSTMMNDAENTKTYSDSGLLVGVDVLAALTALLHLFGVGR